VQRGQLELGVHADRPAGHRAPLDPGAVEHGQCVVDEVVHGDPIPVTRSVGAADAAMVPGEDANVTAVREECRPGVGVGPEPVAEQHHRSFGVVGPGVQPGAVRAGDVEET
jgi:hypothetical protein